MTSVTLPDQPLTLQQLHRLGYDRFAIADAVTSGRLRRPFNGVFVPSTLPDTIDVRAAAVTMVVSRHHVACDRTASWLHGIDVYAASETTVVPEVEVCALRDHQPTRLGGVNACTRDLIDRDVTSVAGVLVTSPLRTALDLGCHLRRREALATLDAFARFHSVSADRLFAELPRFRRRRGVIQLRELVPLVDARAESPRESWTRLALLDAGLPEPDLQVWVDVDGIPMYRLDLAYPRARIAIEYDGWEFHERTQEQRDADRARRDWLRAHGWTVIIVRRGDFTEPALARWIAEARTALAAAYTSRRW